MRYFVEIKTTGLSAEVHQVIEISFLSWEGKKSPDVFRMSPAGPVDTEALRVAGLTSEDLLKFPERKRGLEALKSFLLEQVDKSESVFFVSYVGEFFSPFWGALLKEVETVYPLSSLHQSLKTPEILSLIGFARDFSESEGTVLENYKKSTVCMLFLSKSYEGVQDLRSLYLFLESRGVQFHKEILSLDELNSSQKQAVLSSEGALLVLAGAGSGKTRVIISKILFLIQNQLVLPSQILAVTFTNKAAKEMQERLYAQISHPKIRKLSICTFHALGLRILREEYESLGYSKEFSIFGESEKEGVIRDVLLELKIPEETVSVSHAKNLVSLRKNRPDVAREHSHSAYDESIFALYEKKLVQSQAFDFDDLIHKPLFLMDRFDGIRNKWSQMFPYILVDEYQDTNEVQFRMLFHLCAHSGNLCVVGDDDQSIYAFRGADVGHILSFQKSFPNAQKILLDYNYRNAPHILTASMALISHNTGRYEKRIFSGRNLESGSKIPFYEASDPENEAEWVATELFSNRIECGVSYSDQAILCRTNTQMRVLEKALRQQNIPYRVLGGFSFFDRAEVKNVFAYLRLLHNPKDNQAFYRAIQFPKRGVGEKTLLALSEYALQKEIGLLTACAHTPDIKGITKKASEELLRFSDTYWNFRNLLENSGNTLSQVLEDLYVQSGLQDEIYRLYRDEAQGRLRSLQDILEDIQRRERRRSFASPSELLEQYLQETLLSQLKEEEEEEVSKVSLMTIHSSKGLEFRTVFIPGFQEGLFPHEKSRSLGEQGILEERRLCYVAFTRAKDFLFLSMHKEVPRGRENGEIQVSRFLDEVPQELLEQVTEETSSLDDTDYLQKMREILQMKE